MATGVFASGEMAERMPELAALLRACRTSCVEHSRRHLWEPIPGSRAARDVAEFEADARVRDSSIVLEAIGTYLELGVWHCGGLAAVLEANEVLAAPWPLTRAILEACGRVMWVIGDPSGSARERLARAYIDNIASAKFKLEVANGVEGQTSATAGKARSDYQAIRAEVTAVFPTTTRENIDKLTINGVPNASLTATVKVLFAVLERWGGISGAVAQHRRTYDMLSNNAHPTLYTFRDRREYVDGGDHVATRLVVYRKEIDGLVALAVAAIYNTLSMVCQYCGWSFDPDKHLEQMIDRILPTLFAS
ncbi:hypothetical protein [Nocardia salmonicida]|uniref:hypothetical protein n=1 Tax=Nocardia salmonicida TaxID=53431 RepID=UPI0037AF0CA6